MLKWRRQNIREEEKKKSKSHSEAMHAWVKCAKNSLKRLFAGNCCLLIMAWKWKCWVALLAVFSLLFKYLTVMHGGVVECGVIHVCVCGWCLNCIEDVSDLVNQPHRLGSMHTMCAYMCVCAYSIQTSDTKPSFSWQSHQNWQQLARV